MSLTYKSSGVVVPMNRSGKTLEGFITLKEKAAAVAIDQEGIWCDPEDITAMQEFLPPSQRSSQPFLAKLRSVSKSKMAAMVTPSSVASLRQSLCDLEAVGWNRVDDVSSDLSRVVLRFDDDAGRRHLLELSSDSSGRRVKAELPCHVTSGWAERKLSLSALFDLFSRTVSSLESFFHEMDALDAAVWILEPERATRADTARRIALGEGSSLRIEVNPSCPRHPPHLQFLGPESFVDPLRQKLDDNFTTWDPDLPLLENLEKALEMHFPKRSEAAREAVAVQCGVCYSFNLAGELPEESCRNAHCHEVFHASCLLEWLRMLPSSHRVFNTLHGECPYCRQIVVVTIRLEK